VVPNLFGAAYDAKALTLFTALGVSHDHILYLGVAALVPIGFCVYWLRLTSKKRRNGAIAINPVNVVMRDYCVFFVALAALSLVIMMAAPLYVPLTQHVPILQVIRVAVRAGVLFLLAASGLVALGTDLLLVSSTDLLRRFTAIARRFVLSILCAAIVAVVVSYALKLAGFAVETTERGRLAFIRKAAAKLTLQFMPPDLSIVIPLVLLLAAMFLVWALGERQLAGRGFIACAVALLLADLFWNANQFDHTFKRSLVFPSTEITDRLRALQPGRVLVTPSDLETNRRAGTQKIIAPPNTLLPYQIATVTGKNQQFPKWYREFASLIEPQPNLSHVVFDQYRSRYFDLLDVRYVITHESAAPLSGYDLLDTAEGISLYENKRAMPRAFLVHDRIEVASAAESLEALRDVNFDPHTTAVIETGNRIASPNTASNPQPPTPASATIVADKRNSVEIETDNDRDSLLVLSDNYYPGWRANVDGAPAEVLRANHTMRAVNVPAGHHVVSFAFMPATFFVSLYVSLAAAVLTMGALIVSTIKRRRE
jgi:hypothetical protein